MLSRYRSLDRVGRWYLLIYVICWSWPILFATLTPPTAAGIFLAGALLVWAVVTTAAGIITTGALLRHDNLVVERIALTCFRYLLLVFPLVHLVSIGVEISTLGHSTRWHGLQLGILPFVVLTARSQQLNLKAKQARETPLPGEEA